MLMKILPMLLLLLPSHLPDRISLFLLPNEDIVNHCTSAENDAHADKDTRHDGGSGVELDEGVQNDTCEEHGDGHEEAPDGAHPGGG